MAKKAKEKEEDLDFFFLGEEKNAKSKVKTSTDKKKTMSSNKTAKKPTKKLPKNKSKKEDLDAEIIIGVKQIQDKPKKNEDKPQETKNKKKNKKVQNKTPEKSNAKPKNSEMIEKGKKAQKKIDKNKERDLKSKLIQSEVEIDVTPAKKNVKKSAKAIIKEEKAKKKRKRIFRIIKVILLIAILVGGLTFFLLSPIFNLKSIEVTGNKKITSEEILSLSKMQTDENTFKINKKDIKEKIKQNTYIDTVSIKRTLPDKVTIIVTEREATYKIPISNSYMLINNQGYMLEIKDEKNNLPIITGIKTLESEIKIGNRLCVEDLEKLEDVLKIMESSRINEIDKYINKINISDKKEYQLNLDSQKKIVHLGDTSNLALKMLYISEIIEKEKDEGDILVNKDLNTKGAIFRKKV